MPKCGVCNGEGVLMYNGKTDDCGICHGLGRLGVGQWLDRCWVSVCGRVGRSVVGYLWWSVWKCYWKARVARSSMTRDLLDDRLYNRVTRYFKLVELDAPACIVENERRLIVECLLAMRGKPHSATAKGGSDGTVKAV